MIRISLVQLPLQFFFRYLDNVGIAGLASQSDKAIENWCLFWVRIFSTDKCIVGWFLEEDFQLR